MITSKTKIITCITMTFFSCGYSCAKDIAMEDSNPLFDMGKDNCSSCEFWASIIMTPFGHTNTVYYAGTIDGNTILVHETSVGTRKWNLKDANIERTVVMPYTDDRNKWVLLKGTNESRFHHWDWRREIEYFIQKLPRKSALVRHTSFFYRVDGELSDDDNVCIFRVDEFVVETTLCNTLSKGEKICTEQLYDSDVEEKKRILSEARHEEKHIVGGRRQDSGLRFACWDNGGFFHPEGLPTESYFIIDNEIVAPFEFMWNNAYDGLLEFDEKFARDTYIKRSVQKR